MGSTIIADGRWSCSVTLSPTMELIPRNKSLQPIPICSLRIARRSRRVRDIFGYVFSTARFSPKGANRAHYSNPTLDVLLSDAEVSPDTAKRREDYVAAQKILAHDLPAVNLWYLDTVVVHNRRLTHVEPTASGSFTFLKTAELAH